jgi:hypothetical protein
MLFFSGKINFFFCTFKKMAETAPDKVFREKNEVGKIF